MTADPRTQLAILLERRDLAAYRCVAVIGQVLDFFEAQDFESAEKMLSKARDEFRDADRKVTELYEQLNLTTEKRPANGITTASKQPNSAAS